MGTEHRKQYLAGAALTLAMAAFLWVVLSQLGRSNRQDLFLADTADQRFGWRYEVLAGAGQRRMSRNSSPTG